MAIYSNLSKLGRVKLPSGSEYALIDVDGRAIIAPNFNEAASYAIGDHVIYGDNLYRFNVDHSVGAWNSEQVVLVTIDTEIKRIEGLISEGVHYRGKTTTALYEGASTNPISIGGSSYTAANGDLVLLDLANVAYTYAENTAYAVNTYIVNGGIYYITTDAITAGENTSIGAIAGKINVVKNNPEFLFDGSVWNIMGSIADGLGDLAFKDSASGTYIKPTGTGSVGIHGVTSTSKYLARGTVVGTDGTVDASEVTGGVTKDQWRQDGTINYGTADVDSAVTYGTANPDTPVSGIAKVGESKTFTTQGVVASVDGDCLTFGPASSDSVIGIADTTGVSITPAIASNLTLTPAKAADSSRTAVNLVSDGSLTGSYTITPRTPAKVAASASTFATGALTTTADGDQVIDSVTETDSTASVVVNTTTDTVTVR